MNKSSSFPGYPSAIKRGTTSSHEVDETAVRTLKTYVWQLGKDYQWMLLKKDLGTRHTVHDNVNRTRCKLQQPEDYSEDECIVILAAS